jgi:hypothetical protein
MTQQKYTYIGNPYAYRKPKEYERVNAKKEKYYDNLMKQFEVDDNDKNDTNAT